MGKIVFWIFLVFAVLLGLRLLNAAKRKARDDAARDRAQEATRRAAAPLSTLPGRSSPGWPTARSARPSPSKSPAASAQPNWSPVWSAEGSA